MDDNNKDNVKENNVENTDETINQSGENKNKSSENKEISNKENNESKDKITEEKSNENKKSGEVNKPELKVVNGSKNKKVKRPKKASNIKKLKAIKPTKRNIVKFVKANRTSLIAVVAIIILLIIAFLFSSNNVIKIGEKQIMFSKEYSMSSKTDFYVYGENIFYVSKDGMIFLDKKGETLWSDTFTMSAPYMLSDGEYVAVADSNSKTVNIYDRTGRLYQISTAGEITSFAINPIGCCAVVCKIGDDYRVDVYSNTGETMFECARASKDGIPLGIDISDDGSIVSMTLVDYNDIKIKSSVLFYYTTKAEAQSTESSDGLISAIEIPEAIAGITKFLPNKHCIVASDKSMMSIDCSSKSAFDKKWEKTFENFVTAFDIVGDSEIAVAYGEAISVTDENAITNENTVHWYNVNGREIGTVKADDRISDISSSKNGTIITVNKEFIAYTSRGRELWKYDAVQNVSGMQFYNSVDRVILITPTKMQLLDVKKGVTMQEETEVISEDSTEKTTTEAENETTSVSQG